VMALVWWIPLFIRFIPPVFPGLPGLNTLLSIVAYLAALTVFCIGQVLVLDPLLFLLSGWKPVRRFLSLGWTRRYRRYTAPGFKPLKPV
jgi:hypothetical protein